MFIELTNGIGNKFTVRLQDILSFGEYNPPHGYQKRENINSYIIVNRPSIRGGFLDKPAIQDPTTTLYACEDYQTIKRILSA